MTGVAELEALAGPDEIARELLGDALLWGITDDPVFARGHALLATSRVDRFNNTRALMRFYELAEAVDEPWWSVGADRPFLLGALYEMRWQRNVCWRSTRGAANVRQVHARHLLRRCPLR